MKYIIVRGIDATALEARVNERLERDWVLKGDFVYAGTTFYQAMTKEVAKKVTTVNTNVQRP